MAPEGAEWRLGLACSSPESRGEAECATRFPTRRRRASLPARTSPLPAEPAIAEGRLTRQSRQGLWEPARTPRRALGRQGLRRSRALRRSLRGGAEEYLPSRCA